MTRFARLTAVGLAVVALTCLGTAGSALAASSVANPTVSGPVTGGVKGYPWNKSLYSLKGKGFDYSEKENFFSGTATDLATGASAPYTSRMLVRLPKNPKKFRGGILVAWLQATRQATLEPAWPVEAQCLMRHGVGYVGVSAQLAGICCGPTTLKGWDPQRYASLAHP